MPNIKLPYTEEGIEKAEELATEVEEIGGEVIYPSSDAADRSKVYQVGGVVQPNFPQENPAVAEANKMGQELKSISLENIPTSNSIGRKDTYAVGGKVLEYKKGGGVK